jgi:hypothetical protein
MSHFRRAMPRHGRREMWKSQYEGNFFLKDLPPCGISQPHPRERETEPHYFQHGGGGAAWQRKCMQV